MPWSKSESRIRLGLSPLFTEMHTHSMSLHTSSLDALRVPSLPSAVSWNAWDPRPWEALLWIPQSGISLTPSVKPRSSMLVSCTVWVSPFHVCHSAMGTMQTFFFLAARTTRLHLCHPSATSVFSRILIRKPCRVYFRVYLRRKIGPGVHKHFKDSSYSSQIGNRHMKKITIFIEIVIPNQIYNFTS